MTQGGEGGVGKSAQAGDRILRDHPTGTTGGDRFNLYLRCGKRCLDFLAAVIGLVVTSPLLLACAVAVRLDSREPVFFRQWRIGQHGWSFQVIKLRTMVHKPDQKGLRVTTSGDPRITRVGRWLRRTKIDEIPQLFNVLWGEMSLVGPRPEVPEIVAAYSEEQRRVLQLKPGMTGPASLAFIDEEETLANQDNHEEFYLRCLMPQKLELDLAYCDSVTFLGDLILILRTVGKLIHLSKKHEVRA